MQLGIVQSDVLAFVARLQNDPVLTRIAKKTKMVFPLYNEEVHLVGKRGIAEFDDLAGRRVAVGREGSGTYLTARLLFKLSEVTPSEMVLIDTQEALTELKAGRVDAMFYVAGYPVRLLKEDISDSDQLAVIPILNKSIVEFYPRAEIPAGTYAWQPTAGQHGGRQGGAGVVRLPPQGLRRRRQGRSAHRQPPGLVTEERTPQVEGRGSELSTPRVGAVRLRAQGPRQAGSGRRRWRHHSPGGSEPGVRRDQGGTGRVKLWRLITLVAGGGMLVVLGAAALIVWPLVWPPDPDASVQLVNGRLMGEVTGYVGRVDRDARTLDVSASLVGWRPVPLTVNESTSILVQNRQGAFGDLWKDLPVRVSYEVVGDARLAKSIEVVAAESEIARAAASSAAKTPAAAAPAPPPAAVAAGGGRSAGARHSAASGRRTSTGSAHPRARAGSRRLAAAPRAAPAPCPAGARRSPTSGRTDPGARAGEAPNEPAAGSSGRPSAGAPAGPGPRG